MGSRYLRVKNWGEHQHYKDKEPGWIKFYARTLRDNRFLELSELEQWQLVRLWLVASQASRFTHDEEGRKVPVVVDDELSLRRSIGTLKKIPMAKLIRDGWLVPVAEDALLDAPSSEPSPTLDTAYTPSSPLLEVEGREVELPLELKGSPRPQRKSLPVNDHLLDQLVTACGTSADPGTATVFRSFARQLPEASLAKVIETTRTKPVADRARYAAGALRSEVRERTAA